MPTKNLPGYSIFILTRPGRPLLSLVILLSLLSLAPARADSPHRVGLVVAHGDEVTTKCIEFSEDQLSGYEVLERSGLDLNADVTNSMGAAICRIDNQGCAYPQEQCFCQCQGTPCIFWSYWHLQNNAWQFSSQGASNYKVSDGAVEGWKWGEGTPNRNGFPPPVIPFEQICAAPPTSAPTNTPTATPTLTPVPPTNTPLPTATRTPIPKPVIHSFHTDRATINAGESVTLSWDLSGAKAAFLRYDGLEEGVVSPGSKTISPAKTTVYTLVARNNSGEVKAEVTITVNTATAAPTISTSIATVTPTAAPEIPTASAAVPEPVIHFSASASTLPPGACIVLQWDAPGAGHVYLDEVEVGLQDTQPACPTESRAYTLRAVYPGGNERAAQVMAQVMAVLTEPPPPPAPSFTAAPNPLPTGAVTATPAAMTFATLRPVPRDSGRNNITTPHENNQQASRWVVYGGAAVMFALFLAAPLLLLGAAGAAWWLRRRR